MQGKGDTKAKAFADALSGVQQQVLRNSQKLLLRIEPLDVRVLHARVRTRREKFLFFFLARERGAITAQNKYGYRAKHGMRSVDEGVTAINEGATVLGFGFMDKEELGERLVQAWNKKHGS
ncbi:hypothetical protein CRX72_05080 [Pantoea sp. BRM17]|nr:hypothetical protein CRX72_05080 [Pantoea sp. BRM17]